MDDADALTLDQLRVFLVVVQEGSFSAAARRLRRAQSAVSYAVSNLERLLDVQLFDRSARMPALTDAGRTLLSDARAVHARVDQLKARARALSGGLEPQVALAVDAMCPTPLVLTALAAFQEQYPTVPLRLHTEALGAVTAQVLNGTCQIGISGPLEQWPVGLVIEQLAEVIACPVVSPRHPLARLEAPIPADQLDEHTQIVLTDRSNLTDGIDRGVLSSKTWRVADLGTKLAILKAGFGWGTMPYDLVKDALDKGELRRIQPGPWPEYGHRIPLFAVHRAADPPGQAGRWLLEQLERQLAHLIREIKPES